MSAGSIASSKPGPWQQELDDFARAFSGAFLFGIPLLYTMEMWWLGTHSGPITLLLLLGVAFGINLGLTHVVGFKRESAFGSKVADSIEVVAVGLAASFVVLLVLNRISPVDPLPVILGTIVVQTVPLSIGASVANTLFAGDKDRQGSDDPHGGRGPWQALLRDVGATAAGAAFIAFSVAPTEEIPMLATGLDFVHLLALIAFSLLVTYVIVFESGFGPRRRHLSEQLCHSPFSETALAYVVALAVAAGALTFFNQWQFNGPIASTLTQVVVLGLPAAIGGAAGRLVFA